jgi:ribosomal-protein-alanine N-acetyltransferase
VTADERQATRKTTVTSPAIAQKGSNPPVLKVGDLHLRPLQVGDEEALLQYLSDPAVLEHTSIPLPTLQSLAASVARDIAAYRERTSFRLALADADDRVIGMCGFNNWSPLHKHAELAYELAPHYWGRGYMRNAVLAILQWGFAELGLNRVHAFVMTTNARSIRLLEHCGFVREGTLRQFRIARGEPKDFHLYALLAPDFASNTGGASAIPSLQRIPPG